MASAAELEILFKAETEAIRKDIAKINEQIGKTETQAKKAGPGIKTMVGAFAGIAAVKIGIDAAVGGLKLMTGVIAESVMAASDLNETTSKATVVFGDQAQGLIQWSENAATALGMTQNAALGAAATYGNLFQAMGVGQDVSADMSQGLVQLAADLASFNNMDPTEVLEKLRAGVSGEAEPLKQLGAAFTADELASKALELGLVKQTAVHKVSAGAVEKASIAAQKHAKVLEKYGEGSIQAQESALRLASAQEKAAGSTQIIEEEMDQAAKAQASYALIMEKTGLAHGDFERTSDGLANAMRIIKAQIEDTKASLGEAFLPVVEKAAGVVKNVLGQAMTDLQPVFDDLAREIGVWVDSVDWDQVAKDIQAFVKDGIEELKNFDWKQLIEDIKGVAGAIAEVAGWVGTFIDKWHELSGDPPELTVEVPRDAASQGDRLMADSGIPQELTVPIIPEIEARSAARAQRELEATFKPKSGVEVGLETLAKGAASAGLVEESDFKEANAGFTAWREHSDTIVADVTEGVKLQAGIWKEEITTSWEDAKTGATDSANELKDNIGKKAGEMVTNIKTNFGLMRGTATDETATMSRNVTGTYDTMSKDVTTADATMASTLMTSAKNLRDDISEKAGQLRDNVTRAWENLKESASEKWGEIVETIRTAFGDIREKWDEFKADAQRTWDSVTASVSTAFENIKAAAAEKWEQIRATIDEKIAAARTVLDTVKEWPGKIAEHLTSLKTEAQRKFDELKTRLGTIASEQLTKAKEIGKNIVDGMRKGIEDKWDEFKKFIEDKIGAIPLIGNRIIGATSPSKEMAKVGKNAVDGLTMGMRNGMPEVEDAAREMAGSIMAGVNDELDAGSPAMNVFEAISDWIDQILATSLKDKDKKALEEVRNVVYFMADLVKGAADVLAEIVRVDLPDQGMWDTLTSRMDGLMDLTNRFAVVVQDWAKGARDSTNSRALWGELLDREEIRNILELAPALTAVAGIVRSATDMFAALAEWEDPGPQVLADMSARVEDLARFANSLTTQFMNLPFISGVPAIAGAIQSMAAAMAEVADLDLTGLKEITDTSRIEANMTAVLEAIGRVGAEFMAWADNERDKQVAAIQDFAQFAQAALGLFKAGADASKGWEDVSEIGADALATVYVNVANIVAKVKALAGEFLAAEDVDARDKLVEAMGAYADMALSAVALMRAGADASKEWEGVTALTGDQLATVYVNVANMLSKVRALAGEFLAAEDEWRTNMVDGIVAYAEAAGAAVSLFAQAAGITVEWEKVTAVTADALGVVAGNVQLMVDEVQRLSDAFWGAEGLVGDEKGQTSVVGGIQRYTDMANAAVSLLSAAGGVTVDWTKVTAVSASALGIAAGNVQLMLDEVERIATAFWSSAGLDDADDQDSLVGGVRRYTDMASAAVNLLAQAGGLTVDWSKVAADIAAGVSQAAENVKLILGRVGIISAEFRAMGEDAQKELTEGMQRYTDMARGAVDLMSAGAGFTADLEKMTALTAELLAPVVANVKVIVGEAKTLVDDLLNDPALGMDKLKEIKEVMDLVVSPVKALSEASAAMGDLQRDVRVSQDHVRVVLEGLKVIFDAITGPDGILATLEVESTKARVELVVAGGNAAEALGKVGEFFGKFLENPFFADPRQSKGFRAADRNYIESEGGLKDQMVAAIRNMVAVLVGALNDDTVQKALASVDKTVTDNLDILGEAYGKVADVLNKLQGVTVPGNIPAIMQAIADMASAFGWTMPGAKTTGGGGGGASTLGGAGDSGGTGGSGMLVLNLTNNVQLGPQTLETLFSQLTAPLSRHMTFDMPGA